MSGHSKWAQIKRQKGVADIKRGQMFTKVANAITIAVRQGGGITDPESNFRLRLAIEKAKSANMPKENIERAIERGKGVGERGEALEEVIYEGFGPGGIAVIVECATNNKQRTLSEVKNTFEKNGGTLGQPGSVSYQFKQVGLLTTSRNKKTAEEILSQAVESGAEDLEEAGEEILIYTSPTQLMVVKEGLEKRGEVVVEGELSRKPTVTVPIKNKETLGKVLSFIQTLENLDDVQKVYSNFDIPDELINSNI